MSFLGMDCVCVYGGYWCVALGFFGNFFVLIAGYCWLLGMSKKYHLFLCFLEEIVQNWYCLFRLSLTLFKYEKLYENCDSSYLNFNYYCILFSVQVREYIHALQVVSYLKSYNSIFYHHFCDQPKRKGTQLFHYQTKSLLPHFQNCCQTIFLILICRYLSSFIIIF